MPRIPRLPRAVRRLAHAATVLAAAAAVILPATPASAAVIGIDKSTTGVGPDGVEPGDTFQYVIRVDCTSLSEDCVNGTMTDTLPAEFTYSIEPGTYTWSGGPDTDPPGGTVFPGIPNYTYTYDADTRAFTVTIPKAAAGSSASVQIGATLPSDTGAVDGTKVTNTAEVSADNAPSASDSTDVTIHVPVVVGVSATKDWQDGSALAGSGEKSTVTLGVTNESSSGAGATSMSITDQTTGTPDGDPWNYFDLTGFGAVAYPDGADQVKVSYCTLPYAQVCGDGDWTEGTWQTGATLRPDAGVEPASVTGLRFEFADSGGDTIPDDAAGSVAFDLTLRDTERVDGTTPIEPTTTQTVTNSATPTVTGPHGTTEGDPATDTFQIVPDIASVDVQKKWFADENGDYNPDGIDPSGQTRYPVSSTIDAKNTSGFPVETVTIREPSESSPKNGLDYMNVTQLRFRFPDGATSAHVTVICADGSRVIRDLTSPPGTVTLNRPADFTCPAGGPDDANTGLQGVEVVYAGPPGTAAINPGATAGLDVHGTLNDDAVPGGSPYTNCADGQAVNTGNGSTSATATGCANLTVVPELGPSGPGTKWVSQTDLPEDTPISYTIDFLNDSGKALTDFHIIDPSAALNGDTVTEDTEPFASLRLTGVSADCAGATIDLLIPDGSGGVRRVPTTSATAADYDAARAVDVHVDPLPKGARCRVGIFVERRPGVPNGLHIPNCYTVLAGGGPAVNGSIEDSTACSEDVVTGPPNSSASLQKYIEPGEVTTPTPGLPKQEATVKLRVANEGNTHLKSLQVTDFDDDKAGSDFFRSFDFVALKGVSFPPGADLVQVDVCTTGCATGKWIKGTPTASDTPPLPGGVKASEIQGVRVTFRSSYAANGGYNLVPGENFPDGGPCPQSSVCFTVTPRATDRTTGKPVLGTYTDTADGHGEARGNLGGGFAIPPVDADLTVVAGRPAIDVDKAVSGSASIAPGQTAYFDLTVTNTGTAALPDLEIADPIPDRLEFRETAVSGGPYSAKWTNLPPGTGEPGPAQFTMERDDNGRVTRLVWKFPGRFEVGSKVVIRIGMTLAPGTLAGTVATNVMGAGSSTTDDFDCSGAPPDGITDGDPFLPGRNCTDSAKVTTLAGASFTARKWVAGNPDLALYDTVRKEYVPLDDPACPRLERQGVSFTRFPCVALVYPGEDFTFLGRLINSGTYRAVNLRMIDALPRPGDTGVVDPAKRGTMWDTAPTLVAPPQVAAPTDGSSAAGTLTYTQDEPPCSADLRPPNACTAKAWDDTFDPDATGFQLRTEFTSPGLAPGASIDVVWKMSSPADPGKAADPSIAWNSFGHTELIDTPGDSTQLGAVEPQKTGVGVVFGNVRVDKRVDAEPGAEVPDGPYELRYECTVTPAHGDPVVVRSGEAVFGPGEPWELNGVPANATCTVWETDTRGGDGDHPEGDPLTLVVPWNRTADAATGTITNTFRRPPVPPVPPTPPGPGPNPGPDGGGALPETGGEVSGTVVLGVAAALAGLALIGLAAAARRRRT